MYNSITFETPSNFPILCIKTTRSERRRLAIANTFSNPVGLENEIGFRLP
jgi:hypothetical protein